MGLSDLKSEKRNFKNALSELKRKNEKLFRSVLTALGRDNVFGSTSSGRRRPFLTPLGITVLGYLQVGAENCSLGAENIKSRKFVDSEVPPHQDLGHLCAKI